MAKLITSIKEWLILRQQIHLQHQMVGFVPTMGNLHQGHCSLIKQSVIENKCTVLSIFVNPTQFNNASDLDKYPRTLEEDIKLADQCGADIIIMPRYEDLYHDHYRFRVTENDYSKKLCGAFRPGHFDGVLTVVLKLLQLIKPQRAYFGEKDFQQLQLVRAMTAAFFIDAEIIACPTVRDENGIALSSRNNRLSAEQYQLVKHLPRLLQSPLPTVEIINQLSALGFVVDYVEEQDGRRLAAVYLGDVRLIDNIDMKTSSEPYLSFEI